jgi:hypothetical protein
VSESSEIADERNGKMFVTSMRAISLMLALGLARADAATPDEVSAPPQISTLLCRDVATSAGENLADQPFQDWFRKTMASVALGITVDEAYKQFLAQCGREQNLAVV